MEKAHLTVWQISVLQMLTVSTYATCSLWHNTIMAFLIPNHIQSVWLLGLQILHVLPKKLLLPYYLNETAKYYSMLHRFLCFQHCLKALFYMMNKTVRALLGNSCNCWWCQNMLLFLMGRLCFTWLGVQSYGCGAHNRDEWCSDTGTTVFWTILLITAYQLYTSQSLALLLYWRKFHNKMKISQLNFTVFALPLFWNHSFASYYSQIIPGITSTSLITK